MVKNPQKMAEALAKRAMGGEQPETSDAEYAREIMAMNKECDQIEAFGKVPDRQKKAVRELSVAIQRHRKIVKDSQDHIMEAKK